VPGPASTIGAPVDHLDLATVLKVSQAVSGEIVLEKLLDTLMRTALAHAGAERGLLLLPRGDGLRIEAEATTSGSAVTIGLRDAPISSADLPEPVVQYAARTQESVILDDASARGSFSKRSWSPCRRCSPSSRSAPAWRSPAATAAAADSWSGSGRCRGRSRWCWRSGCRW
jgi:hypothetical protein